LGFSGKREYAIFIDVCYIYIVFLLQYSNL